MGLKDPVCRQRGQALLLGIAYVSAATALLAILAVSFSAYAGPSGRSGASAAYQDASGAIRTGGAEHGDTVIKRLNAVFIARHPSVRFGAPISGTASAIPALTYGKILFGVMGRTANEQEVAAYKAVVGAAPLEIRIAHASSSNTEKMSYSLGVYVHRDNPIDQLSVTQIDRMLTVGNVGGDYSQWGQLGLNGEWATRRIHPYGTPAYTGMGIYMVAEHWKDRSLALAYEPHGSSESILARLAQDPAGIAFAAIDRSDAQIKQVRIVRDDGGPAMLGSRGEAESDRYPYGRYVFVYVRREPGKPLDPLAKAYLELMLSSQGQAIISSQDGGYLPLTERERSAERAKFE